MKLTQENIKTIEAFISDHQSLDGESVAKKYGFTAKHQISTTVYGLRKIGIEIPKRPTRNPTDADRKKALEAKRKMFEEYRAWKAAKESANTDALS